MVAEAEAGTAAPEAAIFYGSGSGSGKRKMNGSGSGSSKKILEAEAEAEAEAIKNSPLPHHWCADSYQIVFYIVCIVSFLKKISK